ncbi:MAG: L-2,4-diaminobutyric acid acetyltransferase [Candidatus Carbobacillus altaicus]|uniref:L-2,4-diaminobutyric acid acetyltransferase n=1 Tax=Candidatus Carbonibacillus altaicus TaxID=2163959 RepID=A0A2R6XYF4_9BACL|nr:MAG: L-2,4-diaminobutyric acid acetyltransferase [Candidatus Carbobacillus altaicus]
MSSSYRMRHPEMKDGASMHRLMTISGNLEANAPYTYMMMAHYFGRTSYLVEKIVPLSPRSSSSPHTDAYDAIPVGYVLAFHPPQERDALFVWQIGVAPEARGQGLGKRLLMALFETLAQNDENQAVRYVLATVDDHNTPSKRLFQSLARAWGADLRIEHNFFPQHFFPDSHASEHLYRIGPIEIVKY